jgi:hypothetical protein
MKFSLQAVFLGLKIKNRMPTISHEGLRQVLHYRYTWFLPFTFSVYPKLNSSFLMCRQLVLVYFLSNVFVVWAQWDNSSKDLFEGDIIPEYNSLSKAYGAEFAGNLVKQGIIEGPRRGKILLRATVPNPDTMWDEFVVDDYKIVDVFIDDRDYSTSQVTLIKDSLKEMSKKTATVKFRFHSALPSDGRSFLNIGHHSNNICASYVGRTAMANQEGGQALYLANGCINTRTVQHETLHALGFWHEQNRPDRDEFIDIKEENIMPGLQVNFMKREDIDSLGSPYDYQ